MKKYILALLIMSLPIYSRAQETLWGVTTTGGIYASGVLFKLDVGSATFTKLHDFNVNDTNDGGGPLGSLVIDEDGKIYGITQNGGNYHYGMIYSYDTINDSLNVLCHFPDSIGKPITGGGSGITNNDIILMHDSLIFGISTDPNISYKYYIYQFNIHDHTIKRALEFASMTLPASGLTHNNDSLIYGVTGDKLYRYNFVTGSFGQMSNTPPMAGYGCSRLTPFTNGKLYGTARYAGPDEDGAIYVCDPLLSNWGFVWYAVTPGPGGCTISGVTEFSNNTMIGTCAGGSQYGKGMIYKYDLSNPALTTLYSFNGTDGASPYSDIVINGSGIGYGTTIGGGTHGLGVIYKIDFSNNTYTKIFDFDSINGQKPGSGSLLLTGAEYFNINESSNSSFNIFPNPVSDMLTIESSCADISGTLTVSDLRGQLILTQSFNGRNTHINFSALPAGFYIIAIRSENMNAVRKIIKL